MALSDILGVLRRPRAEETAATLAVLRADAEEGKAAAVARRKQLEAQHGDALLADDPEIPKRHEAAMQDAAADIRRFDAIIGALEPRIEAARERELDAALRAEAAKAQAISDGVADAAAAYAKAAREVLAAADKINAAERQIRIVNMSLRAAGRSDLEVAHPMASVWPHVARDMRLLVHGISGPRDTHKTLRSFERDCAGLRPPPPAHQPAAPDPNEGFAGRVIAIFDRGGAL